MSASRAEIREELKEPDVRRMALKALPNRADCVLPFVHIEVCDREINVCLCRVLSGVRQRQLPPDGFANGIPLHVE